jgi:hypothetical protein
MARGAQARLLDALKAVVDGRLDDENEGPADMRLLRLAALAALARNGAATPAMLGQTAIPVADMPTAMLADWLVTLDKVRGVDAKRAPPPRPPCAAGSSMKARGSTWSTASRAPWWMMIERRRDGDQGAARGHRPARLGSPTLRG